MLSVLLAMYSLLPPNLPVLSEVLRSASDALFWVRGSDCSEYFK